MAQLSRRACLAVLAASGALSGCSLVNRGDRSSDRSATNREMPTDGSETAGEETDAGTGNCSDDVCQWNLQSEGVPQLLSAHFTQYERVTAITKFRAGYAHSLVGDLETCRAMKHYCQAESDVEKYAPMAGTVTKLDGQPADNGIIIRSSDYPASTVDLGHVDKAESISEGTHVAAGQYVGTTSGGGEITIGVSTPRGFTYVSLFDAMTDDVFADWQAHGVDSREEAVISRTYRDRYPLQCEPSEHGDGRFLGREWVQDTRREYSRWSRSRFNWIFFANHPRTQPPGQPAGPDWDVELMGLSPFVTAHLLEPVQVTAVTYFRSGYGQPRTDSDEFCRHMGHFLDGESGTDWTLRMPFDGRVTHGFFDVGADGMVRLRPDGNASVAVDLRGLAPHADHWVGKDLVAGDVLGTRPGNADPLEIVVTVNTPDGTEKRSLFGVMVEGIFADWKDRGIDSRETVTVARTERDAEPFTCADGDFTHQTRKDHDAAHWLELE